MTRTVRQKVLSNVACVLSVAAIFGAAALGANTAANVAEDVHGAVKEAAFGAVLTAPTPKG